MALTAIESMLEDSRAHETDEPKVEAIPKIGRSALSYLEPRPGLDGLKYAGQCAACSQFVPEISMMGALVGDRCVVLGSTFPVSDDSSCRFFMPWGSGLNCDAVTSFFAIEMRKGIMGAVSPGDAGYLRDCNTQCSDCEFYAHSETVAGRGDCKAFTELNSSSPNIFALDASVHPRGGCDMWRSPDSEDDFSG